MPGGPLGFMRLIRVGILHKAPFGKNILFGLLNVRVNVVLGEKIGVI